MDEADKLLEQAFGEDPEDNRDLDGMLVDIGKCVEDVGSQLAKRRRKTTPYDRFTLEEMKEFQKALKNCSGALKNVRKIYQSRYSEQ